jgi:pimeloyl-ACP methyl ester carboxylesterase
MKVYFISGLAADRRVFNHIVLPEGFTPVYLDWIKPLHKEVLQDYSIRLAGGINRDEEFILIGLSMGGMIAAEIAKMYEPRATILVSSAPTHKQLPIRFKVAWRLRLHRIVPARFFKSLSILKRLFTAESAADKKLLRDVIRDSDPEFIRWALGAVLQWRNEDIPEHLWHIHGTRDHILPFKRTRPTHVIQNGSHLMIVTRAEELNHILHEILVPVSVQT